MKKTLPAIAACLSVILFAGTVIRTRAQEEEQQAQDAPIFDLGKGKVLIERKGGVEAAETVKKEELTKGEHPLDLWDKTLITEEGTAVARVGGCEIRLSDNTTFLVKEVDEDYTIISVLDVELELDRGTIIECAFGSLDMTCVQGAVAVRPEPGFIQVIIITLPDGKKVQTTLTDGATFDIQPNASGDFVIVNTGTTPIEFTPIDPISGEPAGDPVPVAAGEEAGEELALLTDGGTVTEILIPEPPADEPPPTDAPLLGTSPGTTTTSVSVGLGN